MSLGSAFSATLSGLRHRRHCHRHCSRTHDQDQLAHHSYSLALLVRDQRFGGHKDADVLFSLAQVIGRT
jgi:hypothetical protein